MSDCSGLSGRVQELENQMETFTQELLQRVDLVAASSQAINWNQQFDSVDNTVATMKSQLQNLQVLYTNLYIRFQSTLNSLTAATGRMDYGSFYSTGNYLNSSTTGINKFEITNTAEAVGISIVSGSRVTVSKSGVYNIQFSSQFSKTDAGNDLVDIWLSKNGNLEPWSNSRITVVGNNGTSLPAWNFVYSALSGDYFEMYWHSADIDIEVLSITGLTNPTRPEIPALILTIEQIR